MLFSAINCIKPAIYQTIKLYIEPAMYQTIYLSIYCIDPAIYGKAIWKKTI